MAHTPGPWTYRPSQKTMVEHDVMAENYYVAECFGDAGNGDVADNARLIAAAPDLLAALQGLIDGPGDGYGHASEAEISAARAAIAKATAP